MMFNRGDEVIFVRDFKSSWKSFWSGRGVIFPEVGKKYVARGESYPGFILLEGITNRAVPYGKGRTAPFAEAAFREEHFRRVVKSKAADDLVTRFTLGADPASEGWDNRRPKTPRKLPSPVRISFPSLHIDPLYRKRRMREMERQKWRRIHER